MNTEVHSAAKITCRRCSGRGFRDTHVVYAGAPGTCFACAGVGEVYKDKFYRAFGVGKKFVGVTNYRWHGEGNPNNGVFKFLGTEAPTIGEQRSLSGKVLNAYEIVEITEDQARRFWARYGERTQLGGVRVADFDGVRA
jgi:hypothetical protein